MTVYLLISDYQDGQHQLHGVFTTRALAEAAKVNLTRVQLEYASIERLTLDLFQMGDWR
jgi:tRNA (Thr-GGU) A37 N-methylase